MKGGVNLNNFDKEISNKVKSYLDENVQFSTEENERIHQKIKQGYHKSLNFNLLYWTVLASAATIFLILLSLSFLKDQIVGQDNEHTIQGSNNGNITIPKGEELAVDLSDIEEMNIGAEMPRLLYADNNIAVMQGTFGVVVYNMQDSIVMNRISYDQIKSYGITMMLASVSQDGSTIFIGNDDMYKELIFTYQYDISTRIIKEITQQPTSFYIPITIETPGYNEEYDKYFDLQYITADKIVEFDNSFLYLRSPDWNMKNLQIVICQYVDGESKVFDVFK